MSAPIWPSLLVPAEAAITDLFRFSIQVPDEEVAMHLTDMKEGVLFFLGYLYYHEHPPLVLKNTVPLVDVIRKGRELLETSMEGDN